MKGTVKNSVLALALIAFGATTVRCGKVNDNLAIEKAGGSETVTSDDTNRLIEDSVHSASGSSEDYMHPFAFHGGEKASSKAGGQASKLNLPPPARLSPKSPRPIGTPKPIPADILALLKASNEKKDAILGVDRAKIEEVLKALRQELEDLRASNPSPEDFKAQAKAIQEKYVAQLREVLPKIDSLTQEQKDSLKAIHELQHGVIKACVAPGADAASDACTKAKADLQAKVDAP